MRVAFHSFCNRANNLNTKCWRYSVTSRNASRVQFKCSFNFHSVWFPQCLIFLWMCLYWVRRISFDFWICVDFLIATSRNGAVLAIGHNPGHDHVVHGDFYWRRAGCRKSPKGRTMQSYLSWKGKLPYLYSRLLLSRPCKTTSESHIDAWKMFSASGGETKKAIFS